MAEENNENGEKQVTFNHLAINIQCDNDLVSPPVMAARVRMSSKCKWFIGIGVMVVLALVFVSLGLVLTFTYQQRQTKELSIDGEKVKIEEVRMMKWSKFQATTSGVLYKTSVGDETKMEIYDEESGATVRIEQNQVKEVAVELDSLIQNALIDEENSEKWRLLNEETSQETDVITYDEVKHKITQKIRDITQKKTRKEVAATEKTATTQVYHEQTTLLQVENPNPTEYTADDNDNSEGESTKKGQSASKKFKKQKKSQKITAKNGLRTMAEVDKFVNSIASDYSQTIDLALQTAQQETTPSSSESNKNSKKSTIMNNCATISIDPPAFQCREDPKKEDSADHNQRDQLVLKVIAN